MPETVRIYIGSDVWQKRAGAEDVLEYSIRKHTTADLEIHWMRAGDPGDPDTAPGFEVTEDGRDWSWRIGRASGQAWPKKGWGTDFSNFRVAVPELAGFHGKAIYLDADMLVLGDILDLWELPHKRPWLSNSATFTDVSVIDCAPFKDQQWWPSIEWMKASHLSLGQYRSLLNAHLMFQESLSWDWNCRDGRDFLRGHTNLVHFTSVPHQPWRPYQGMAYMPHPRADMVQLWNQYREEAHAARN